MPIVASEDVRIVMCLSSYLGDSETKFLVMFLSPPLPCQASVGIPEMQKMSVRIRGFCRRSDEFGAQGHNSLPPEHVGRRLQFVDSGAEPLEFDAATLRLPTSSLQVTTPPNVDFATEWCRRGINDGPGYYPDDLNCAQGHNSLPPEHVGRRLQFVDSGAEPLEFDAATLRLPTSSLQVTTPPNVDFATEWCRRGINDGPGYYPDDLNCRPNVLLIHLV
ncbi:hypothetical protein HPB51_026351 [Rhipicephalus microplus]|uniref:Uncharacterized protein n=1 Tax=Rhipicephalus microplus TaxID=6941 RepID=A0A9J6D3A3_RHIMP|nr:hypothetical protein HPB51_026351 [Rhipicephalus microplus]